MLGLVKARMVKNAVIVPHGSEGGFVCKQLPPPSRARSLCRRRRGLLSDFINALLDLTDNLKQGDIIAPADVKRRDEATPIWWWPPTKAPPASPMWPTALLRSTASGSMMLSLPAAPPATTTKAVGITARGAWGSVKRHFRHLGEDIQNEDFAVVGIGDMGGDVFGNGMLLSRHIRLKAAFNHRHIFIDPDPDAAASFAERSAC